MGNFTVHASFLPCKFEKYLAKIKYSVLQVFRRIIFARKYNAVDQAALMHVSYLWYAASISIDKKSNTIAFQGDSAYVWD